MKVNLDSENSETFIAEIFNEENAGTFTDFLITKQIKRLHFRNTTPINSLDNNKCYEFTNIFLREYIVTKLTTTPTSIIKEPTRIDPGNIEWTAIDMTNFSQIEADAKAKLSPTLIKPDIINCKCSIYPPNLQQLPQACHCPTWSR